MPFAIPAPDGQAYRLIKEQDWSQTSLGSPRLWPDTLKVALGLILRSPESMYVMWGPERLFFFNDAYLPILGAARLHRAVGRPAAEVWSDVWEQVRDTVDRTYGGESFRYEDQLLHMAREGVPEETYWTYSFSPLCDPDGVVAGLFCATREQTQRIDAERRVDMRNTALTAQVAKGRDDLDELQALHDALDANRREREFVASLTAKQRRIPHPEAILQMTADELGAWLKADRVGFFTVAGDALAFGACWTSGRVAPLRGRMSLSRLGDGAIAILRSGQPIATENCQTDPALNGETFTQINAVAMVGVPLIRDMAWTACLYVNQGEPRHWSPAEKALVQEVAELTWDAVERTNLLRKLGERIDQQDTDLMQAASDLRTETTGRTSAEDQVRQLQKMEAVGQLTGGIAHDFNNMLAVVIGGLNLLQRRLARGDTNVMRFVDSALDGATRAANLTHRLLAFSRQQPLAPAPLDVNRLIGGMDDMLDRSLGDEVKIETVLTAGLWTTMADMSQLENALLNLAVNARDVMPNGGKLTIETSNAHVDAGYAIENEIPEGQYVVLSVTDTGTGMTPDVLKRVFEPFFTTKGVGKGTGLGLSQVFGFVRQTGGTVKIYSEAGVGTTIKIYLPRHYGEAESGVIRRPVEAIEPPKGGDPREIILVVEDEERVRNFAVDALRELGYTVIHAESGAEAMKIIEGGQDVTLLFTDIVMAGMTGRQLVDKARPLRPAMRILYTTGFTRNAVVHNGVIDAGTNLLAKPFSLDLLAATVRRVLDGK